MNDEAFYHCGRYWYNFSSSGLFTLINKEGEPLYDQALPFFEKLVSHSVWIFFWVAVLLTSNIFLPGKAITWTNRFIMSLIFFHLFLLGCRLTTLLIKGGIRPILFPPFWIRLTRKFQKGEGLDLLKKYHLQNHPGLLTNLAIAQYSRKEFTQAHHTLRRALTYAPDHPVLLELFNAFGRASQQTEPARSPTPDILAHRSEKAP